MADAVPCLTPVGAARQASADGATVLFNTATFFARNRFEVGQFDYLGGSHTESLGQMPITVTGTSFTSRISQKRSRMLVSQRLPNLLSVYHAVGNRSDGAPDTGHKRSARGAPRA